MEKKNYKKSHKIFIELRDRIVHLEYKPGTVLSEKELCDEFNVSRTPLREVIFKLEEMKLLKSVPRFGTYVTHIDATEIRSTFEVKIDLDMLAGSLAVERISKNDIEELKLLSEKLSRAVKDGDKKKAGHYDDKFHKIIWRSCHNEVLTEILINLHARCHRFFQAAVVVPDWELKAAEDHGLIVDALKKRDKKAVVNLIYKYNSQAIEYIQKKLFNVDQK